MSDRKKALIEYLLPALCVGILFLSILAINGLYPFGKETIDYYDMAQQAESYYYHTYDALHGLKSFVFDKYTCLGRGVPGMNNSVSIFNLLLFLFPRDKIMECMSFFMMIKIMFASSAMCAFLKYVNQRMPYLYTFMMSAGYGLCGFVLVNYTIPQWLDMYAFVPLLLLFGQKALATGRSVGLAVMVFVLMVNEYYFSMFALVFLFLVGGIFIIYDRVVRAGSESGGSLYVSRFVIAVIIGAMMSAFSWLPDLVSTLGYARFGNGIDDQGIIEGYLDLIGNTKPAYISRWFSLLGLSFPTALVVVETVRDFWDKKITSVVFRLICIFVVTSQLVLESTHLLLHFGSYVNYPDRNSYLIYCVISAIAAEFYIDNKDSETNVRNYFRVAILSLFAIPIAVLARYCYKNSSGISDHSIVIVTMLLMLVFVIMHIVLILIRNEALSRYCLCIWTTEMLIFGIIMMGKPLYESAYGNDPEQEGEYIRIVNQLRNEFGEKLLGEDVSTRRVRNPDASLNSNYGMVMQRETLAGWTLQNKSGQINGAMELGYSSQYTRLLDSGGNIFSDTILHITDLISHEELDEALYAPIAQTRVVIDHLSGKKSDYHLYHNRFEIPFAIPVTNVSVLNMSYDNIVDLVNAYAAAVGFDRKIAVSVDDDYTETLSDDHRIRDYMIKIDGKKTLYFSGKSVDTDFYNTRLYVNKNSVRIPSIGENDNEIFPAHFNNNTVELGTFEDEYVSVTVDMDVGDPQKIFRYWFYEIDLDELEAFCNYLSAEETVAYGKRSLHIDLDDSFNGKDGILIPISYDNGWKATANGKELDVQDINGLFMFIPSGNEDAISLSYFPPAMKIGYVLLAVSLVWLALFFVYDLRKTPVIGVLDVAFTIIYIALFVIVFSVIYVIPAVYAFVK